MFLPRVRSPTECVRVMASYEHSADLGGGSDKDLVDSSTDSRTELGLSGKIYTQHQRDWRVRDVMAELTRTEPNTPLCSAASEWKILLPPLLGAGKAPILALFHKMTQRCERNGNSPFVKSVIHLDKLN